MNYKQIYAIREKNKNKILEVCPKIKNWCGIYLLTRREDGIKYAYVGQAIRIVDRLADHLKGYQHIDISLKKHGLYNENNLNGWQISYLYFEEDELNQAEQKYILMMADQGYQLYNHTTGSQGKGKAGLKETVRKGYNQGLENGYKKAKKEVANLFEKHLNVSVKKEGNKNQIKALQKFEQFIEK